VIGRIKNHDDLDHLQFAGGGLLLTTENWELRTCVAMITFPPERLDNRVTDHPFAALRARPELAEGAGFVIR
jgi:hypothetical protein